MYVRRDRSALTSGDLFRGTIRRRRMLWVYPLVVFALGVLGLVIWQIDLLRPIALYAVGIRPTPTLSLLENARRGDLAFWRGDLDTAIAAYRAALSLAPNEIGIGYEVIRMLVYRSYAGGDQGAADRQEAVTIANRLLEVYPNNARILAITCLAYARASEPERASQYCNRALSFDTENPDALAFLSQVYYDLGRYDEAVTIGRKALELNPTSIEANTAYGLIQLTSRTPEAGIPYFVKAAEYNKQLEYPYFNLALNASGVGLQRGDPDLLRLAVGAYDTILATNKRNVRAYIGLCQVYFAIGERNLARDNCVTATELAPDNSRAWRWLGEISYLTMEYETAAQAFERCFALESGFAVEARQPECWVFRGLSYVQMGDCRKANLIFTEALSWIRGTTSIERINKGLRICTGRPLNVTLAPTATPEPLPPEPDLSPRSTIVLGTGG